MSRYGGYALLGSPATSDEVLVLDVSDTSMGAAGTQKLATIASLLALGGVSLDSTAADFLATGGQSAGTSSLAARADHVHPGPGPQPSDCGVVAWTGDPFYCGAGAGAMAAGKLQLNAFWVRKPSLISNMAISVSTAGVTLTSGQNLAGIYSAAGTLMGQTADQSAVWNATGTFDMAITSPFTAQPGMYWSALLGNGTTPAAVRGTTAPVGMVQIGQPATSTRAGIYGTGLTALPASLTLASISAGATANVYCVVIH